MKIAIAAGGSGGHIYPALALAEELEKRGHSVTFFGSADRMEKQVIPERGFTYKALNIKTTRGGLIQKVRSLLSIFFAYFECLKLLKGYDMAIGFGNYISIPIMEAAIRMKLKTVIHEQNSYVGRANRLLDEKVNLIIGSYKENLEQFKNKNIVILGNPQSSKAYAIKKDPDILKQYGLSADKKTVVIFMGSLGSASVNEKLIDYFKLLDGSYQVIFATGSAHYEKVKSQVEEKDYLKIYERIDALPVVKAADLLLCRAGATTLSEICALGAASILIPSPYVPNNHQYYNALSLVNEDAAEMIEEKDLSGEIIKTKVESLLADDQRRKQLANNALRLGNPDVLNDIIEAIEKI